MKLRKIFIITTFIIFNILPFNASSKIMNNISAEKDVEDIIINLPKLEPITWRSPTEKHQIVVFIDNQCIYCTDVIKNVKKYNDAGLTMHFITVAPKSIHDSVISDMARVWCSANRQESLTNAMVGFLPNNESSPHCRDLIEKQSALAERVGVRATPAMVVLEKKPVVFLGNVKPETIIKSLNK
ncbi:thioredoxin-like domain protein [Serratia sp. S1B]|nr:thioredoxin-like domain protein [Serratia sp. S1B]